MMFDIFESDLAIVVCGHLCPELCCNSWGDALCGFGVLREESTLWMAAVSLIHIWPGIVNELGRVWLYRESSKIEISVSGILGIAVDLSRSPMNMSASRSANVLFSPTNIEAAHVH